MIPFFPVKEFLYDLFHISFVIIIVFLYFGQFSYNIGMTYFLFTFLRQWFIYSYFPVGLLFSHLVVLSLSLNNLG